MKTLGPPFSKIVIKMIKKHYLKKVSATRFQNAGNLIKQMGDNQFCGPGKSTGFQPTALWKKTAGVSGPEMSRPVKKPAAL